MIVPMIVVVSTLLSAPPAKAIDPLCAKREPCLVVETLDAGQDEQGRSLQVKRLSLGWLDLESGAQFSGKKFAPKAGTAKALPADGNCEAIEWWLLRSDKPPQLLLSVCDDYQGAVREETVSTADNSLTHERSGVRRSERWTSTRMLRLSPLRVTSDNEQIHWTSSSTKQEKTNSTYWDHETLQGEVFRAPPDCQPGESSLGERTLPYLPQVQVDRAYLENGWKQTALGACGLAAENLLTGKGQSKGLKDVSLKALLVAENTLVIEVSDDKWTGPSANWRNDDHVEVWLAPLPPHELSGCGKPTQAQQPSQWRIRMMDGQVFPGSVSSQQKLQVERAEVPGGQSYRLKVKLPTPFLGISVIYSDSDDGKKPEATLATSPFKSGRPETLNPVYLVYPKEATCAPKDGKLSIVPGPELQARPDQAVLQME